jgi:hypothetical protein
MGARGSGDQRPVPTGIVRAWVRHKLATNGEEARMKDQMLLHRRTFRINKPEIMAIDHDDLKKTIESGHIILTCKVFADKPLYSVHSFYALHGWMQRNVAKKTDWFGAFSYVFLELGENHMAKLESALRMVLVDKNDVGEFFPNGYHIGSLDYIEECEYVEDVVDEQYFKLVKKLYDAVSEIRRSSDIHNGTIIYQTSI